MTAPLRVIQLTDTHLQGRPGGRLWGIDVDQGLSAVLQRLRQRHWPADLILATGDLVQDEGLPAYRRLGGFLEPLGVPVHCLPGNHDTPEILRQAFAPPARIDTRRHVLHPHWQFILLDSSVAGSPGGHLARGELDFLDQTLRDHPERHAMICLHHQPRDVASAWLDTMTVDNGVELFQILDRHPQVRAVIYGHIHQECTHHHGQVPLLGAPSTCVQFKPGLPTAQADDLPPGYRWFRLFPDGRLETGVERALPAAGDV